VGNRRQQPQQKSQRSPTNSTASNPCSRASQRTQTTCERGLRNRRSQFESCGGLRLPRGRLTAPVATADSWDDPGVDCGICHRFGTPFGTPRPQGTSGRPSQRRETAAQKAAFSRDNQRMARAGIEPATPRFSGSGWHLRNRRLCRGFRLGHTAMYRLFRPVTGGFGTPSGSWSPKPRCQDPVRQGSLVRDRVGWRPTGRLEGD
jgi:hypothetical protein